MSRQQGLRLGTKGPGVKTDCVSSFLLPKTERDTRRQKMNHRRWDSGAICGAS